MFLCEAVANQLQQSDSQKKKKKKYNNQKVAMELVTYWDPCKRVSHKLEIFPTKEIMLLQYQVQLGIEVKV